MQYRNVLETLSKVVLDHDTQSQKNIISPQADGELSICLQQSESGSTTKTLTYEVGCKAWGDIMFF